MLSKDIYAIYTDNDERSRSIKELFFSFEEAMEARYKYANWCSPKGDVWIKLYEANSPFKSSHSWHINPEGKVTSEYNF